MGLGSIHGLDWVWTLTFCIYIDRWLLIRSFFSWQTQIQWKVWFWSTSTPTPEDGSTGLLRRCVERSSFLLLAETCGIVMCLVLMGALHHLILAGDMKWLVCTHGPGVILIMPLFIILNLLNDARSHRFLPLQLSSVTSSLTEQILSHLFSQVQQHQCVWNVCF